MDTNSWIWTLQFYISSNKEEKKNACHLDQGKKKKVYIYIYFARNILISHKKSDVFIKNQQNASVSSK